MKSSLLQNQANRRPNSHRPPSALPDIGGGSAASAAIEGTMRSPSTVLWIVLHAVCCLASLVLGFRFSRLFFFLLFSASTIYNTTTTTSPILHTTTTTTTITTTTTRTETLTLSLPTAPPPPLVAAEALHSVANESRSHVVVGRHGIRIRPWPYPNPNEVMRAHRIMEQVQRQQRLQYGVKGSRPAIVVTPTYVRTFQALHLTGLIHTLRLVPYPLTWIVIEADGLSNETAAILAKSQLQFLHIPFLESMPEEWAERHLMEARMRLHALRVIRERRLDGIVVFADDSNMHRMELFDEIQQVNWMGAVSVGILANAGSSERRRRRYRPSEDERENAPLPIQGPACNSSGGLAGWHTFNSLPYARKTSTIVGDAAEVLPVKLEWAGFVLNSRLLWREAEGRPDWVVDLDAIGEDGEEVENPLALVKDPAFVEPLGNCGKKVLLWWIRVEARRDSKFPLGWSIENALDITIPATLQRPDAHPEIPFEVVTDQEDGLEIFG